MPPSLLIALSLSSVARAADLHIGLGQPFTDVASAVAVASSGDRLLVHPGTYGPIALAVSLEIVGVGGAGQTVIEGSAAGPAVLVASGTSSIRGLTLSGGGVGRSLEVSLATVTVEDAVLSGGSATGDGGCALLLDAAVTLRRTTVTGCSASNDGGGLFADRTDLTLDAVVFSDNDALDGRGGGAHVEDGSLEAAGSVWTNNQADDPIGVTTSGFGGGLYVEDTTARLSGCRFEGNVVTSVRNGGGIGGALRTRRGEVRVERSVFTGNLASERGSAIASRQGAFTVTNTLVLGNTVQDVLDSTPSYGGALFCEDTATCTVDRDWFEANIAGDGGAIGARSPLTVQRTMFCANEATSDAGAIDLGNAEALGIPISITNSVFSGNTAQFDGGAIVADNVSVSIVNNHFVDNEGTDGGAILMEGDNGYIVDPGATLLNNLYANNTALDAGSGALELEEPIVLEDYEWFYANTAQHVDGTPGPNTVQGTDPLLAGAASGCEVSTLAPGQGSPLLDAGDPALLDGDGSRSDIGAFGGTSADKAAFLDNDGDGLASMLDCNDQNSAIHSEAAEICNGRDDDCDGLVDEADLATDAAWLYPDADGDGLGAPMGRYACPAAGLVSNGDDCDDTDSNVLGGETRWLDSDSDGYGDAAVSLTACSEGPFLADNDLDCDDSNPTLGPPVPWWPDADTDGHGTGSSVVACAPPGGDWAAVDGDCDDTNDQTFPGAPEQCNELDDDCNDLVDDEIVFVDWWPDADGDDYGDPSAEPVFDCLAPGPTWTTQAGDCDDSDVNAHPGGVEVCGGGDEDCDDLLDQADDSLDPTSQSPFWSDTDGDGYGDAQSEPILGCEPEPGTVANPSDCDDTNSAIHPGAIELPADGIDQDCDTQDAQIPAQDSDGDGIYDNADPSPDDAGGALKRPPKPPYGCSCDQTTTVNLSWMALLALLATRRR